MNVMKKTFLTILVLALAYSASAQKNDENQRGEAVAIGIRVGGNLASYKYTEYQAADTLPFDAFMNRVKPMLGLNVEIPLFNGIMYVAPEVAFAVRGDSRLFESAVYDTLVRYQAKVNYLEARVPVSVAIPVSQNFKPYVFASPSFSLALPWPKTGYFASEIKQYSLDKEKALDNTVAIDSSNMSPYDFGLTVGAGLRFRFNFKSFSMVMKLEGGYHMGFLDTYSEKEHANQATAVNLNQNTGHQYNAVGKRLNRGIEAAITIAIPLSFHSQDDCFYWSEIEKRKNKNRGFYGF
jgi:hypothetical protein